MDFPGLPQRQNTPYIAHFSCWKSYATSAVLPLSHKSSAFVGTLYLIQFRSRWFFFFPKRQSLFGTLPCVARPTMHFSRAAARVSSGSRRSLASGDHAGLPLRRTLRNMDYTGRSRTPPLRNPRQLVNCFSTRHSRALDETSRFRATTWGRPYGCPCVHFEIRGTR